jgi:hypothetical protein
MKQGDPDGHSRFEENPTIEELAFRKIGAPVAIWLKYADGEWTEFDGV